MGIVYVADKIPKVTVCTITGKPINFIPSQVDAAVLQYQNQKLVHQLETQKQELHDLESNIKQLKEKQTSYDDILIKVNQLWNQVAQHPLHCIVCLIFLYGIWHVFFTS